MVVTDAEMREIVDELASRDDRFALIVTRHPLCPLARQAPKNSHFESLVESVISQQLSVKAADTIYRRLRTLVNDEVTPHRLIDISEAQMREAGVSQAKVKTIRGLVEAASSQRIDVNNLHDVDDDEIIAAQLTSLWGIGAWTVDMFMMSQLGRLDVWPTGDLGVRRGWQKIYALSEPISPRELSDAGEALRPYRSVVAWYCWQEADAKVEVMSS